MEKKNIDWGNLGFGYMETDYRFVSYFKDGKWDDGELITDPNIVLNECSCVLQYAQTVFEGLKAYTTEDGRTVVFRPDLNGERLEQSAARLKMPVYPKEKFIEAVKEVVKANEAFVPPFGHIVSKTSNGKHDTTRENAVILHDTPCLPVPIIP